jgi:hypothetical protein
MFHLLRIGHLNRLERLRAPGEKSILAKATA